MSPSGQGLWSTIAAVRRRVRADGLWATAGLVAVLVPAVLVVAWLASGAARWRDPGAAPLALEVVGILVAAGLGWWLFRRWIAAYDERHAAAAAEETLGLPAGTVRGVLELSRSVPEGTSAALYQRAEGEVARHLSGSTPAQLAGAAGAEARRRRNRALLGLAAGVVVVLVLGFASPERASAGWRPLVHPVDHLTPPPMPALEVRPGNAKVPRGGSLGVRIVAKGRREVAVHWRAPGDVPRSREVSVAGDSAATSLAAIDAPLSYWVTSPDGAASDTFRVTPIDPLLVSDLVVDVIYPGYLGRAAERFDGDVPALEVPEGTQLRIRGRATRLLSSAGLVRRDGGVQVALQSTADRFEGSWTPTAGGTYDWKLSDRNGAAPASLPGPLDLVIVPDSAPQVEVLVPAVDTALSPEMKQPIAANVWDDHALRSASLVSWRVSSLGQRDPNVEQAIALPGATDHASIETLLDATSRRLLPGDTLHFQVRVADNSPRGQVGVSRTYTLWIPGMEELRQQAEAQAEQLVSDAAELAKNAKGLQESTRNLSRQSTATNASGSSRGGAPGSSSQASQDRSQSAGYEKSEQARQVLERQEAMVNKVEDLKQRTAQLERAMQAAGLQDPALQQRLKELKQLYDQILTPELRQKLQELKQALGEMDQRKMQQALEQLAQQQDEFQKRIEQSLELLRRAAAEQQMNALAQQAKEMATQQKALSEAMKKQAQQAQTPEAQQQKQQQAEQQQKLAQRADSLSKAIEQMRQQLDQQGEQQAAQQTSAAQQKADSAQKAMQQAAQQAAQQAQQQASQTGEKAAEQMQQAAQSLEQTRKQMSESWKDEVQQAVQQATQEALSLAQRQAALAEKMKQAQQGDPQQGQTPPQPPQGAEQPGAQQSGQQQQAGQQRSGQQNGDQQQGSKRGGQQGNQQGGKQSPQSGGQKAGGKQGQGQGGNAQQNGGSASKPGPGSADAGSLQGEQKALQQSLEQLGKNLSEAGEKSALMNRDVGAALGRALLSMQQTLQGLEQTPQSGGMPVQQAEQTVDALNKLALSLATNGQQIAQSESGTGVQQQLEQLAELAKRQGGLNGQSSSLLPLDLAPSAMSQQLQGLASQQRDIAQKLGGMANMGGQEDVLGRLDELAKEADAIARDLSGGRLTPDVVARQEKLFHRLLDAGRSMERDEVSNERVAERPGDVGASFGKALDPSLLQAGFRYAVPTEEQLRNLPPAYRRMILQYFDRLNRAAAQSAGAAKPASKPEATTTPEASAP